MAIDGMVRPLGSKVIVRDMVFGNQTLKSGIVLVSDDGTANGVRPRWAKVHAKGPENTDDYQVGDWVLMEHGRWTRGFEVMVDDQPVTCRMIDTDAVLLWSGSCPEISNEEISFA